MTIRTTLPKRRGVILLLVLAMMTFFAILVATFMMISSQQYRAAASNRKIKEYTHSPVADLHEAVLELISGSDSPVSGIGYYSLGATLYGDRSFYSSVGQMPGNGVIPFFGPPNSLIDYTQQPGNVITFYDNNLKKWRSTHITDFLRNYGTGDINGVNFLTFSDFDPMQGTELYINGPAFSGTGVGFDNTVMTGTAPRLTLEDNDGLPYANQLNPNTPSGLRGYLLNNDWALNVDYTAPDARNPFLAWLEPTSNGLRVIASFLRPGLYTGSETPDELRKKTLRPLPFDHPNFSGSNPEFTQNVQAALAETLSTDPNFALDVDNDGDGIKDSIWVRTSLPVRSTKDGKLYVPLVSYLVLDMDGRLNVNAHGNLSQLVENNTLFTDPIYGNNQVNPGPPNTVLGIGYGPAAIDLRRGLSKLGLANSQNFFNARYAGDMGDKSLPNPKPGNSMSGDQFDFENPVQAHQDLAANPSVYGGVAPDYYDTNFLAYDALGNRTYFYDRDGNGEFFRSWDQSSWSADVIFNNPYEFDPNHSTPYDQPFTAAELEAILRSNDLDQANLPSRLKELLLDRNNNPNDPPTVPANAKYTLTTHSNDIPSAYDAYVWRDSNVNDSKGLVARVQFCVNHYNNVKNTNGLAEDQIRMLTKELIDYMSYLSADGKLNLNALMNDPDVINPQSSAEYQTGLFKRMAFARTVYLLLMVLSYEQMFDDTAIIDLDPDYAQDSTVANNAQLCRELTATRLAQWAINLVDFTDPDATMTPFVFDVNPFDGWGIVGFDYDTALPTLDDRINCTISGNYGYHDDLRLVWGLEPSDLLLTETLAFHDRRVADTSSGKSVTDPEEPDEDFDQIRIPQGSAFFELYCHSNPNRPQYAPELYTNDQLDLARTTTNSSGIRVPVWRLVIGESTIKSTENSIVKQLTDHPCTFSFQPEQYPGEYLGDTIKRGSLLGFAALSTDILIDRIIWLGGTPDSSLTSFDRTFWNRSGSISLRPNEYLVIGPRELTFLGSQVGQFGKPAGPKIDLRNPITNPDFIVPADYQIGQPRVMIAASEGPSGWPDAATWLGSSIFGIGINVSEPLRDNYYQQPTFDNDTDPEFQLPSGGDYLKDAYGTLSSRTFPDDLEEPISPKESMPISRDGLVGTGVAPLYRSVFLQRVADPIRDYDPVTNPYITVDWSMIDLKVFNGESEDGKMEEDYANPDQYPKFTPLPLKPTVKGFASRQWMVPFSGTLPNVRERHGAWRTDGSDIDNPVETNRQDTDIINDPMYFQPDIDFGTNPAFKEYPVHTLGRLNTATEPTTMIPANVTVISAIEEELGVEVNNIYLGMPSHRGMAAPRDIPYPFLHLPWNDAPLANPYEILQVPASSPGRLGIEFADKGITSVPYPYAASSLGTDARFGHLFNFFAENDLTKTPPRNNSLNLVKLLNYVGIPSRFLGTRDWYDLNTANPYSISRFREPGKINVNTMTEPAFLALMGGRTPISYSDFNDERDVRPFRGSADSWLLTPGSLYDSPVEATMLRLWNSSTSSTFYPLFAGDSTTDPRGRGANTYNALEGLQRLSSMTTTTSNVFAVWVTIGYFEVEKLDVEGGRYDTDTTPNDGVIKIELPSGITYNLPTDRSQFYAVYPDGYMIGRELGSDTGDITRHRAFYLIDRSIPFGYQRGHKLNAEDTILLRKFIE